MSARTELSPADVNAVRQWREEGEEIRRWKLELFPPGCFVRFVLSNAEGYVPIQGDHVPADQLEILFCNGNRWWKPVEMCRRISAREVGTELRRLVLQVRGYKGVSWASPRGKLPA
jgi:hypothetical protein